MLRGYKHFFGLLLIAGLGVGLTACKAKEDIISQDIVTQTVLEQDKIPVTILVKYAFSINTFEKEAEEKFPQLDIIQVGNYTSNMGIAEYEARLEHDDLTDIVMTWPLEAGEQYWEEQLIDLSKLPLTSNYTTAMLNTISQEGKLFYLPGPSQVRGIVYNKTLFNEQGWEVPKDFEGFIKLCQEIEASGMRSLQLGFGNPEVLDTGFMGYGYESGLSKPQNAQWLQTYNEGEGSFADNFEPALATFQTLIDEGVLKPEDLNVYYQDREKMLFTRQCAMVEDSVLLARMGFESTGCTDEFGLMPFFNPGKDADWARLYPVCYIGLNKNLEEPENKQKYDLVMALLEYISTPEGQKALAGDTGAMFSSLKGVEPPDIPEIDDLLLALKHGRYAVFPTLKNAQTALREGLTGMLKGELTSDDVIEMVDKQNRTPLIKVSSPVLGSAVEDFSMIETGNFITDAMRLQSGCEIALFLDNGKDGKYNGKGVSAKLYEGSLEDSDIQRILPDLKHGEKGELWEITMTGEDLLKTLEYSMVVDNNRDGWFYYFSGLKVEYAPAGKPGERIHKITDENGKSIDPSRLYSIAVMDESVPADFIQSCEKTGILISTILKERIIEEKNISPAADGRFVIVEP